MHSPLHCCNLSPKVGMSQLRYHLVPVGFGAGVRDAFSSAKVIETRKGAEFRLLCFLVNSIWGIAEKAKSKKKKRNQDCEGKGKLPEIVTQKQEHVKNEKSTIQHDLL